MRSSRETSVTVPPPSANQSKIFLWYVERIRFPRTIVTNFSQNNVTYQYYCLLIAL